MEDTVPLRRLARKWLVASGVVRNEAIAITSPGRRFASKDYFARTQSRRACAGFLIDQGIAFGTVAEVLGYTEEELGTVLGSVTVVGGVPDGIPDFVPPRWDTNQRAIEIGDEVEAWLKAY